MLPTPYGGVMAVQEILRDIGLTEAEIKVYLAMLELGSSTTGPIVERSGASSSKIYEILDKLMQKGLVSFIVKKGTKHFEAAAPERILDYVTEKENKVKQQKQELKNIIPELELKQTLSKYQSEATIYKGMKGLETSFKELLKDGKKGDCAYVFVVGEVDDRLQTFFKRDYEKRAKRGIKTKTVFAEAARTVYEERKHIPLFEGKVISINSTPATAVVFNDSVHLRIGESDEVISIIINRKELAAAYKEQFDTLWNQDVNIYKGFEAVTNKFWSMLNEMKKGDEYHVLGATYGEGGKKLIDWFERYHAERIKRGINVKLLAVPKDYQLITDELTTTGDPQMKLAELRKLPSDFATHMQINLYPNDKVLMFLFGEEMVCFETTSKVLHHNFKKYFDSLWNQEAQVFQGPDAIQDLFEQMLVAGHCDFIGARGYFVDHRPEFIDDWEKRAIKQGFTMRNIVDPETKGHRITTFSFAETKYTISKEFSSMSVFWIFGDKVAISNWVKKEPIVVIIDNKQLHDTYKKQFEELWKK